MTDRFRYLPCDLSPALNRPWWAYLSLSAAEGSPFTVHYFGFKSRGEDLDKADVKLIKEAIDLTNPHGWDFAVRAYASLRNRQPPKSESLAFVSHGGASWSLTLPRIGAASWNDPCAAFIAETVLDTHRATPATATPEQRREALCRCICAALNLNVDSVFPEAAV